MKGQLPFHVPPDAGPDGMEALLHGISMDKREPITRTVLLERMALNLDGAASPRGEVITLARDLGVLTERPDGVIATLRADALRESRHRSDLIHRLQYFAWSGDDPRMLTRFWTYRSVVDLLWEEAPVALNGQHKKRIVENLLERAGPVFASLPEFDSGRTSVGPKTIDGVACWLKSLSPPVLTNGMIARRQTCPPPLVVLALAAVVRASGSVPGTDFRLSREHRNLLCRCCFLDPAYLDRLLEWTVATQPKLVRWGTSISTYGRQVVLERTDVQPEDLS